MDYIVEMGAKPSAKIDGLAEAQKQGQNEADERWAGQKLGFVRC